MYRDYQYKIYNKRVDRIFLTLSILLVPAILTLMYYDFQQFSIGTFFAFFMVIYVGGGITNELFRILWDFFKIFLRWIGTIKKNTVFIV